LPPPSTYDPSSKLPAPTPYVSSTILALAVEMIKEDAAHGTALRRCLKANLVTVVISFSPMD
jgi:hypothetical protein